MSSHEDPLPRIGAVSAAEPWCRDVALVFALLAAVTAVAFVRAYLSDQPGRSRFFVYFMLSMTGNLGLILAQNLTSFYLFFALMSFASYGLVVHERSVEALHAGRIYIILVVIGEMALLQWGESFMLLGLAAAFYGVIVGLTQRNPKTLLAYSSISQMGVMTVAVGLWLTSPDAYPAILTVITLYAFHHGLSKGALTVSRCRCRRGL